MKRTRASLLILTAVLGAGVGFLLDHLLTMGHRPTFTPTLTLPLMLVLLAAIVLVLALPIRRSLRGGEGAVAVNPFYALRIVILAKASSIVGAAVGGVTLGLAIYLLSRPVPPPLGSLGAVVLTAVSGAVLVTAALIAEHMCIIRKDDDDEPPEPPALEHGHSHS